MPGAKRLMKAATCNKFFMMFSGVEPVVWRVVRTGVVVFWDWIGSSHKDLVSLPDEVQDDVGFALHLAQIGEQSPKAKVLSGFGGAGVLEVVENWHGDTYRAVYTVRFAKAVYVLHCFQKKSKSGIATRSRTWTRS